MLFFWTMYKIYIFMQCGLYKTKTTWSWEPVKAVSLGLAMKLAV